MLAETTTARIGLLGEGTIYETLQQHLSGPYALSVLPQENLRATASQYQLILVCHDSWSAALCEETNMLGQMAQVAWLPIYSEFDRLWVGPCTQPEVPGCFACAERRRQCAIEEIEIFRQVRERLEQKPQAHAQPWLTPWVLHTLLPLLEAEIAACLHAATEARTVQAVLSLHLSSLRWRRHRFLPNSLCPGCGKLPADSAEAADTQLKPHLKATPTTFRVRSLSPLAEQMDSAYVDTEFGLIHHITQYTQSLCPHATAKSHLEYQGKRRDLPGYGRTFNAKQSIQAAVAEYLERYGGQFPQGKRTVVRASFRQLGDQALDPVTLGLPTQEQSAQPGYRLAPYHPDLECNWVWGYSFGRQRPILVPEFYAYYGYPEEHAFVYEISNGCALGSCQEEAILYGMLETLERDAFLLTWYAQLGVPQLDRASLPDQSLRWLLEHLEYISGYTISLFNTTLLHGAPCCWVMATDTQQRADFPRLLCGAGSHLLPEQAILGALLELAAALNPQRLHEQFQKDRQRALEMFHDPFQVKSMGDHSTLYMLPEAAARLDFLTQTPRQQTFQEAFEAFSAYTHTRDLTEDLTRLMTHYQQQGTDTIFVEQTTPEHRALDFHCVKVIMPGMLPMTFGHRYQRTHGFRRLTEWPMLLGYRATPLAASEINPHPHPFP